MPSVISSVKKSYLRATRRVNKKRKYAAKSAAHRFHFLTVWKKAAAKRLHMIGRAIVRVSPAWLRATGRFVKRPFVAVIRRTRGLLRRRPHRSFRLTRRRDYKRSFKMPGYWSFTNQVRAMLWRNKKLFGGLMLFYFLLALAIGGFGQQDAYANLSNSLKEAGSEVFDGNWGAVGQASLLLTTSLTTGLTPNVTEAQSVLGGLVVFFTWLATVWALRNVMANRSVKIREAIYSSGSPVISTVAVAFVVMIQLLPLAIAILVYNAAIFSGFISGGVEEMLLWIALILLAVWSLYWITSTIIALVVVTLPGMYPMQAIRTAGDLVVGRRLRVLYRLLWVALLTVIAWILLVIPVILGDSWIKETWPAVQWMPIVPLTILLMSSVTIVWLATYVYMLYRKVADDEASPA